MRNENFDVVVVGAGPTGLTLAIDLGRRGVRTALVERNVEPSPWPKFDRCNARTMESYRRLGLADRIRELGYPAGIPMDVPLVSSLAGPAHAVLRYPSVSECRARIQESQDGSQPLEPYQLVSQNRTEPLLREVASTEPNVFTYFGSEAREFTQSPAEAQLTIAGASGDLQLTSAFLVGCDGARSTVRKFLGIPLEGSTQPPTRQVIFRSDRLYEQIPVGKGRHYVFLDEHSSIIVAQGDRKEFTLHTSQPEDADFRAELRRLAGFDFEFEILHVSTWTPSLLLAPRFRDGRMFIAGDAAHQVIPTGGLGMNTGVGDALNLSWKLAAAVAGWGGPDLLNSYDYERHRVAERNREASRWAAEGVGIWHTLVRPGSAPSPELVESARVNHARMHGMLGAELGYSYAGSPVVTSPPGEQATWDINEYTPTAAVGERIPHMWLTGGEALQDVLGNDHTLLDLTGKAEVGELVAAFASAGAPLEIIALDEPRLREMFGASLFLLRPDLHIAWRGDSMSASPDNIAQVVTGWVGARSHARHYSKGASHG
jgi:2-polyprenyl-6-methoxyphenol hydroxylase-like FAD-dependent oxidoreductase